MDHAVVGTAVFGDELKRLRNGDFAKDKIFISENRAVVSFVQFINRFQRVDIYAEE